MFFKTMRKYTSLIVLVGILAAVSIGCDSTANDNMGDDSMSNENQMIDQAGNADIDWVSHPFEGKASNLNDIQPVWEGNGNILRVCNISNDILSLYMEDGYLTDVQLIEYVPQSGDSIQSYTEWRGFEVRELFRKRSRIGILIDGDKQLSIPEKFVGKQTEIAQLENAQNYTIYSHDDPDYNKYVKPAEVWIKSIPGNYSSHTTEHVTNNTVYLKLDKPMKEGCSYYIVLDNINVEQTAGVYKYDTKNVVSEAVHTNQAGYRPDDPGKCAYLSVWLGTGGKMKYPTGMKFYIVNENGEEVFTGKTKLALASSVPEFSSQKNLNFTDVYRMDFSDLTTPGKYTLYVEGVGAGYDFVISDDAWEDALKISMKGFYNQRSGIELLPEYTDYVKPRSMHPDDGFVVYASTCSLLDSGNGLNALGTDEDNFGNLVAGLTDEVVENAWGGYFDAGDWDRRITHLEATRLQLELFLLNPDYFEGLDLNIPESSNKIPDMLDEAMWNIDCYKRMQLEDGGIRGGIESAEHPKTSETSWTESLTIMAYAPDHWSAYLYTGAAARLASCLKIVGENELADEYLQSAIKAFNWAEKEYAVWKDRTDVTEKSKAKCVTERLQACADLYYATEDKVYGDIYKSALPLNGSNSINSLGDYEIEDAVFAYTMLPEELRDEEVYKICSDAIIELAESTMQFQASNAFNIAGRNAYEYRGWGFYGSPKANALARAHHLTGENKYLLWLVRATQFATGCNSLSISFTTGLGENAVRYPLIVDQRNGGLKNPPVGITTYGPFEKQYTGGMWFLADKKYIHNYIYPAWEQWPDLDSYLDTYRFADNCEFTVHGSMGISAYLWGYLAQR